MKNVEKPKTFSIYAEYRIGHRGGIFRFCWTEWTGDCRVRRPKEPPVTSDQRPTTRT